MSDIIHKIASGNLYYDGSSVTYVKENGDGGILHKIIVPSGYYSGVITKLDDRMTNTQVINGGGA